MCARVFVWCAGGACYSKCVPRCMPVVRVFVCGRVEEGSRQGEGRLA